MKRLVAALVLALAVVPAAGARGLGGSIPYRASLGAPTGLHAFLLRPDEKPLTYYPRTPSFTWNPVAARGGHYEFELATSRSFTDASRLFRYDNLTVPAVAVDHQLPWITGVPYALWAHVRWISSDGKKVTPWGAPFGFNLRWRDTDYPEKLDAPPGMVRWKPIEGATAYEVLYPDIRPARSFTTTTNVADEREFFTLHEALGWGVTIRWRVRAIRYIRDKDILDNGLPAVTYGPWSATFTSVNPPRSLGVLAPTATISDTWDKAGDKPAAHDLTPGFAWQAAPAAITDIGPFGSSLYRVYVSTDDHCVNTIFTGSAVGSPAFAPRTTNGPIGLPQSTKKLADWTGPPYLTGTGSEGRSFNATGDPVKLSELPGTKLSTSGTSGTSTSTGTTKDPAQVDLWDSGWPTGRFYWTVVPVTAEADGVFDPTKNDLEIQYHDMAVPQDSCESGLGMSFGKVSQPVLTEDGEPWVSGVAPSGRYVQSAGKNPVVHSAPLVAWEPAVGATQYELEISKKLYPWVAAKDKKIETYATAAVLPLGKNDVGTWWYRVRGVNPALPAGAQKMSWSKPVQIRITGDQFVVVK